LISAMRLYKTPVMFKRLLLDIVEMSMTVMVCCWGVQNRMMPPTCGLYAWLKVTTMAPSQTTGRLTTLPTQHKPSTMPKVSLDGGPFAPWLKCHYLKWRTEPGLSGLPDTVRIWQTLRHSNGKTHRPYQADASHRS